MDDVIRVDQVWGEAGAVRWSGAVPLSFRLPAGSLAVVRTTSTLSAALFRLLLGFAGPSSGTITVLGMSPHLLDRAAARALRRRVGCVLDPDGLVANLSVRMNLVVPLVYAAGLPLAEAEARADGVLDVMHLTMWRDLRPAAIPVEMRQTAALARALCVRPELLLLDDPLASVDERETRRLVSLCRAQAGSILIATHGITGIVDELADAVWDWDDEGLRPAADRGSLPAELVRSARASAALGAAGTLRASQVVGGAAAGPEESMGAAV